MSDKCVGGTRSLIEVVTSEDCSTCVGIFSFVNNSNGTSTITLTDGTSYTFTSQGATGPQGVAGATGATGATGAPGASVFVDSQYFDAANETTFTGSFETLDSLQIAPGTIGAGDKLTVFASFKNQTTGDPLPAQEVRLTLNGTDPVDVSVNFYAVSIWRITIGLDIVNMGGTIRYIATVTYFNADGNIYNQERLFTQTVKSMSINLATTQLEVFVECNSIDIADLAVESFQAIYYKKII